MTPSYLLVKRGFCILWMGTALSFCPSFIEAAANITKTQGRVEVRRKDEQRWQRVALPFKVEGGDQLRTGWGAMAELETEDGSRMRIQANGSFTLEESDSVVTQMKFHFGKMRAWVQKSVKSQRRFRVQTPTAVCAVRGTEFAMDVGRGAGRTRVDLYSGLMAVSDNRGKEVLLFPNESVNVTQSGMTGAQKFSDVQRKQAAEFGREMRQEVSLEMSKEEVLAAAARELKMAEYQQGKTMIDVSGNRVRLEQYILRPKPDQFKLVVLNDRADRFDYFYYLGTFNTTLPTDLSAALRQLPGCVGSACAYNLTSFETGRSNTQDGMKEIARDGHQVDVNNNGVAGDRVEGAFDPLTDTFVRLTRAPSGKSASASRPARRQRHPC